MNRIRILREAQGWSQDDLGLKLNVKRAAISKYETGSISLSDETLRKLADVFGVTIDYLLGRTDDPIPVRNLDKTNDWQSMVCGEAFTPNGYDLIDKWKLFLVSLPNDDAMLYQNEDYPDDQKIAIMKLAEEAKQKKLKKIEKFMQYPVEVIDDALIYAAFDAEQRKKMNDEN